MAGLMILLGCTQNNVKEAPETGNYFSEKNLRGTFGLFDNGHGTFTIYNLEQFGSKTQPAGSTFHVVQALIGMETGVIPDITASLFSDTAKEEPCNKVSDLQNAFRLHCDNWFSMLNDSLNLQQFSTLLDTLGYASGKGATILKNRGRPFWNDTTASVTADEQLGLIKKLYFNKLPFQKRTQERVKELLTQEKNPDYTLKYATGGGWVIGWIEENQHPYFFSLYAEDNNGKPAESNSLNILLASILNANGFMHGKK
jgi:beta-lactamase class D